ncbi:hypothetical protein HID58_092900 [Brassica napus]|uniref:Uncharacterized protein n=1 Tax=Brassica napus TaxID=3708 RepID=A0ABQ7XD18_BRANA|nr:hypothetical protein HID58_092900 [Brassica napus]
MVEAAIDGLKDDKEVLAPNPDVTATTASHGIEVATEFKRWNIRSSLWTMINRSSVHYLNHPF